jgi:hypothetical protein
MAELLYPDTWIDADCRCGVVFRRPKWADVTECEDCREVPVLFGVDETSPIHSITGVELVAQKWGGALYLGTRPMRFDRTVDDHPQDVDLHGDDCRRNNVIMVSENEARIYAKRILALLPPEDDVTEGSA